jgi:starvation-inducible DNA-binding protein
MAAKTNAGFTVPGMSLANGHKVANSLQMRIHAFNDLQLTLKHAHWNVVGRDFIGVHEMLDPQIDLVRAMIDALAERMATMGVAPNGLPGALVAARSWDDYAIGRASTFVNDTATAEVYTGIITSMRKTIEEVGKLDPITEDILIGQTGELEQFQWFMRSHLENSAGELSNKDTRTEKGAAKKAK